MRYLSITQTSENWVFREEGYSSCAAREEFLKITTKIGSYWAIPGDAEKP